MQTKKRALVQLPNATTACNIEVLSHDGSLPSDEMCAEIAPIIVEIAEEAGGYAYITDSDLYIDQESEQGDFEGAVGTLVWRLVCLGYEVTVRSDPEEVGVES